MTLEQLRKYDGASPESQGRICVAVNGKIFDVTRVTCAI
jgi:predicted heme/steroid binding protein